MQATPCVLRSTGLGKAKEGGLDVTGQVCGLIEGHIEAPGTGYIAAVLSGVFF